MASHITINYILEHYEEHGRRTQQHSSQPVPQIGEQRHSGKRNRFASQPCCFGAQNPSLQQKISTLEKTEKGQETISIKSS